MNSERTWRVTIVYREPTYEIERGLGPTEFRASFVVQSADEREARDAGVAAFRDAVRGESVGWVREIVTVDVVAWNA